MSLDGFIAGPDDDTQRLFSWYFSGNTPKTVTIGNEDMELSLPEASADAYEGAAQAIGAIVSGRRMFDVAGAWGGKHPMNVPVMVVTHHIPVEWDRPDSPFTFVTDSVASAIAQARAIAGEKNIGVGGADITQQCLRAGLLDEIHVDLVPVLLGDGVPLFKHLGIEPVELERTALRASPDVTHITFRVIK